MSAAVLVLLSFGSPLESGAPERLIAVAPGLWSGAEPDGDAHFVALARLGVKTVVSVDGLAPDVAAARRCGLRTVHVPIGYDGVPADAAASLAAVMGRVGPSGAAPGGVFVHCHHGVHRGPTAAAIAGLSAGLIDRDGALALLKIAGTAPRYAGLWESVRRFDITALPPAGPLREAVPPAGLRAAMGEIDALLGDTDSSPETNRETTTPAATRLAEALRESARLPGLTEAVRGDLRRAGDLAADARTPEGRARLAQDCVRCHAVHRD